MHVDVRDFLARLRQKEAPPPWSLGLGGALFITYLVLRVVMLVGVSFLMEPGAAVSLTISPLTVNTAAILTAVLILILIGMTLRRSPPVGGSVREALGLHRRAGVAILLVLFGLGAAILVDFVPLIVQRFPFPLTLQGLANAGAGSWLVAAAYTVVVEPVMETVLLAGVIYPALAARRGNMQAILLTGVLYALLVAFDTPSAPVLWVDAFLTGVIITGVRVYTQSVRSALIVALMFGVFQFYKVLRWFRPTF